MGWASKEGEFLIDAEKVRLHVEERHKTTDQEEIERMTAELLALKGIKAEFYLEGKADIYAERQNERTAGYIEIVKMLKKAGAR
ncbi:hypothetical protein ES705_26290 [subsurface metagenome]